VTGGGTSLSTALNTSYLDMGSRQPVTTRRGVMGSAGGRGAVAGVRTVGIALFPRRQTTRRQLCQQAHKHLRETKARSRRHRARWPPLPLPPRYRALSYAAAA